MLLHPRCELCSGRCVGNLVFVLGIQHKAYYAYDKRLTHNRTVPAYVVQ